MIERHDYPVTVQWTAESAGVASSEEGQPELEIAAPPEFGGPPAVWSPEHLFVAAVASCFMTTFLAIARASKLEVVGLGVPALGSLVRGDDRRYRITKVSLRPTIRVADARAAERAARIADKAEQHCLITASIRSEVTVDATVEVAEGLS